MAPNSIIGAPPLGLNSLVGAGTRFPSNVACLLICVPQSVPCAGGRFLRCGKLSLPATVLSHHLRKPLRAQNGAAQRADRAHCAHRTLKGTLMSKRSEEHTSELQSHHDLV